MTSGIRFESSNLLEERRQDLRDARQKVLEKAKNQYDKEEKKKEEARLKGEDKWILPSVDSRIAKETEEIRKKKKKLKKEKKKKKKKKKVKDSSSDSEEEWVEADADIKDTSSQDEKKPVVKGPTMPQRESWMEAPLDFLPLTSRQEIRDRKKAEEDKEEKKESVIDQMGQHARELNPYWKDGGVGLPSENKDEEKKSLSDIGDGGLTWLKQSYLRCKEQARTEGRSFEELATERWGSVKNIEKMIADAEKAAGKTSSSYRKPDRDDRQAKYQRPSSRNEHRSRSSSERRKFKRPSPEDDRKRSIDRPRFRRPSPEDSRSRRSRSRSAEKRRFKRPSPEDARPRRSRSRSAEKRKFKRPSPEDSRSRRSRSKSPEKRRFRRPSPEDSRSRRSRSSERRRFKRPSPEDSRSRRSRSRSSEKRKFNRPSPERSRSHRPRSPEFRHERSRRDDRSKESHTPRWKKKTTEEEKPESEDLKRRPKSSLSPSRKSPEKNESRKRSKSSSSEESSSSSETNDESESEEEPPVPPTPILTEGEMNALAAKILKAEIMGNETQASVLKSKLEAAREARKNAPPPKSEGKDADDDEVLLTRTTKSGIVIPLSEPKHRKEPKKGRKRQKKIATHEDGDRQRYFDDDDNLDLKTMVEREKMGTAEDQNAMFARLAGRSVEKTDDDYQVDDMFISKAARQQSEAKLEEKDRSRAIMEHQKMASAMSKCQFCFDKVPKHLIIAIGQKSYLCLPHHKPLTVGHCLIVPMIHSTSCTAIDEDVWQEMQLFRKTLVKLFREKDDEDTIFMETSMNLKRHPHTYIECVPLEREVGDLAPIYFKKAIQDTETEWAQNKKLVDLSKKDIRHSVPKGFPYFAVDFGLQGGFAHVIEDEHRFPSYFGREIVGGMIDASHRLWKNPPKESFDEQRIRVLEFSDWWKSHDWTQNIG